jgi:AbrB family looped-hinge helix DNA binding protein
MTYYVTITSQGQISIPAAVRRELGFDKNKQIMLTVQNKTLIMEPVKDIDYFKGIFKTNKKISFRKAHKAFEEAMARGEV